MNDFETAEIYQAKALSAQNKHFEPNETADTLNELSSTYILKGKHSEAKELIEKFEKLIEQKKNSTEFDYPKRLAQIANQKMALIDQGAAQEFYKRTISAYKELINDNNFLEITRHTLETCETLFYMDVQYSKDILEEILHELEKYKEEVRHEQSKAMRMLA